MGPPLTTAEDDEKGRTAEDDEKSGTADDESVN